MHPTYVMHTIAKVDVKHFNLTVCTGQRRPLQTGDKLSNAHGCKGVVRVLSSDQMPTLPDGTKPDIIINPQTLAQRCVYGKLMETFMGDLVMRSVAHIPDRAVRVEIAKLRARLREGTAFEEGHEDSIQELERLTGFRSVAGRSVLIDPVDGSRMTCYAMDVPEDGFCARMAGVGMMGFSVLKQFPSEKLQARGTALDESYNPITNAPTEGRGRCGGGKRGEMEYDAILCHGALLSLFMGDGMSSDGVMQLACPKCGELADDASPCADCGIRPAYTQISADFRRLIHTLRFIGIDVRLVLEKGESLCELKEVIKRGDYAAVRHLVAESRKDGYWDEEIVETVAEALGRFTADTLPDADAAGEQLSAALGDESMEALKKQIPAELASLL
jgi:DNA-directed RNA polymerase beta subunit